MPLSKVDKRGLWVRQGDKVYLCGTLGSEFDRHQRALAAVSASEAYNAQMLGLQEVENLMDELEEKAKSSLEEGEILERRASPGYGDMPLEESKKIIDILNATKLIGVTLTDSYLLVPSKSVTAICKIKKL